MGDINTERSGRILRVELNRPAKKNALTAAMYTRLADIFNEAAKDEETRVVVWHGAGDAFCAGNDAGDFLKNPPGPGESPQTRLMDAFIGFEKPIVVAVQGAHSRRSSDRATRCRRVSGISGPPNCSCWESPLVPRARRSWGW